MIAAVLAAGLGLSVGVASCGAGGKTTPTGATAPTTARRPPQRPVVIRVNGKRRVVTLSKVGFSYCRSRTDVCAALRGANFRRLSAVGKRAALQARRRKRARQAAAAAAREAARREAIRRQRYQPPPAPPPQPQPQPQGTTTG